MADLKEVAQIHFPLDILVVLQKNPYLTNKENLFVKDLTENLTEEQFNNLQNLLRKYTLEICDRGCFLKNSDNTCKARFKKGMELARKTGICGLYTNANEEYAKNKAKCGK